jgi:TetR/AcrR family transcriptional regulator, cholesterol catabolism regulator
MDTPLSDRKTEILRAASNLFVNQGYHGSSLAEIATAVGMLKGSLYHHIESKEDLLTEIILDAIASAEANLDCTVKMGNGVENILTSHMRYLSCNPGLAVLLREAVHLPRLRRNTISRKLEAYEERMGDIVKNGQRNGLIAGGDPQLIVRLLMVACTQPLWNELGVPSHAPTSECITQLLFAAGHRERLEEEEDAAYHTTSAVQSRAAIA